MKARKAFTSMNVVDLTFATFARPEAGADSRKPFKVAAVANIKAISPMTGQKLVDLQAKVTGKFQNPQYVRIGAKATMNGLPANGTAVLFNGTILKFKNSILQSISK